MRSFLNILLLIIILNSCEELHILPTTTESYGLDGKVEFFSEKTMKIQLYKDWNYSNDTTNPFCFISNTFFNSNGVLDSTIYFDKDSLFLSKSIYNFTPDNQGVIAAQYDKLGKKLNETKFISYKDSIAYLENYKANTKKILSKTWTKNVNSKTIWLKTVTLKNKIYSEWVYDRNDEGNEIGIKTKFGFDENQDYLTLKIKYLKWDNHGNWTKRIEYNVKEPETDCMLKTRYIKYF